MIIYIVNRIASYIFILSSTGLVYAQTRDSITEEHTILSKDSIIKKENIPRLTLAYAALKFAELRPFNVEYTYTTPYNYSPKTENEEFQERKMTKFNQVKIGVNLNLIKKKTWSLGTTIGYRHITTTSNPILPSNEDTYVLKNTYQTYLTSLNFSYFTKVFNKLTVFSSNVIVEGSEKYVERIKGILTGTIVIKNNEQTKIAVGLAANIDPSVEIPLFPTFLYEHKFGNGFTTDINLPLNLMLRKHIFNKARISIGSELDGTSFYIYDRSNTRQKYQYRQLDINSGITYEHLIGKYLILTAKTGIKTIPEARIFKKEESFDDYSYKMTPEASFYFNIGVSFNPFLKKIKH